MTLPVIDLTMPDLAARAGRQRRATGAHPGRLAFRAAAPGHVRLHIGDMLERLTGGWYRSTPHRVRNTSGRGRLSFPFFFDPDFGAEVPPLPDRAATRSDGRRRWDGQNPLAFTGTYGDYLTAKVAKVFPQLRHEIG